MLSKSVTVLAVALVVSLGAATTSRALTFTCTTVAAKGEADPAGGVFGNRYKYPAINGSGDVAFFAYPSRGPRRLYLYPNAGAASVIAEDGSAAPTGGTFSQFGSISINDAGDIGFFSNLAGGNEGVFVHVGGGGHVKAATTSDPSPGGGVFDSFPAVSRVNAAGDIAFAANVSGGPNGVFFFDRSLAAVSTVALAGGPTGDGRVFCTVVVERGVALSDSGNTVFQATTSTACGVDPETLGLWQQAGLGFTKVADLGDASPIGGTTYTRFFGYPLANFSDHVLFHAQVGGLLTATGLFLFDPAGPTTTNLVKTGDNAPGGGALTKIASPIAGLSDGDRAGLRGAVRHSPSSSGLFIFGGAPDTVARRKDLTPTDKFGIGSEYAQVFEQTGLDRSGTRFTFNAAVRNTVQGGPRAGLFRCEGS